MAKYTFFWQDGRKDIFEGESPVDALNKAGCNRLISKSLDFHTIGENTDYEWNPLAKEWINTPLKKKMENYLKNIQEKIPC